MSSLSRANAQNLKSLNQKKEVLEVSLPHLRVPSPCMNRSKEMKWDPYSSSFTTPTKFKIDSDKEIGMIQKNPLNSSYQTTQASLQTSINQIPFSEDLDRIKTFVKAPAIKLIRSTERDRAFDAVFDSVRSSQNGIAPELKRPKKSKRSQLPSIPGSIKASTNIISLLRDQEIKDMKFKVSNMVKPIPNRMIKTIKRKSVMNC